MKKYKILFVDDIFINRILLAEIINEAGYSSIQAKNGKHAIEIFEATDDIDLILMDIEMPVMNGFETTRYIRQKFEEPKKSIPIVAITAHDPNSFLEEYNDIGFDELITKPYSTAKISDAINKLCNTN